MNLSIFFSIRWNLELFAYDLFIFPKAYFKLYVVDMLIE